MYIINNYAHLIYLIFKKTMRYSSQKYTKYIQFCTINIHIFFLKCTQFYRFNLHNSKDLTYTKFSKYMISQRMYLIVELNILYIFKTHVKFMSNP